ncbi:hypothetical protein RUM44_013939 [Polyplax serrata]|uniref:Uncharacterized protein n=1 Tax=Polyplax serrata TaxID=468196 RepID=A0ABR1BJ82_POLSC
MDVTLDEDFVNFESVSRTCASSPHAVGADEELILLDSEVSRRERSILENDTVGRRPANSTSAFFCWLLVIFKAVLSGSSVGPKSDKTATPLTLLKEAEGKRGMFLKSDLGRTSEV